MSFSIHLNKARAWKYLEGMVLVQKILTLRVIVLVKGARQL